MPKIPAWCVSTPLAWRFDRCSDCSDRVKKRPWKKCQLHFIWRIIWQKFDGTVWSFPWCGTRTSTELEGGQRAEIRTAVKDSSGNTFEQETFHSLYPSLFSGVQNNFPATKDNYCLTLDVGHFIQHTFLTPCVKKDNIAKQWEVKLVFHNSV